QGLLRGFSEEKGFGAPKEEERIKPQLSYESKKKIAEDYIMEDIPLTKREKIKEEKIKLESVEEKVVKLKKDEESSSKPITTKEKPSFSKKDDIYLKLSNFFEELFVGYNERYDRWENSVSALLAILRKMRKITKKNTEDLVSTINNQYEKIQKNLEEFKIKRDEIEKISDVDIEIMSSEFKKVLGLLELQVKEYQLKKLTDEYIHQYKL
ncbi:MAG: hypothetical protein ACFFD5_15510, partial [Candidatus Thorarchaeota archaeon]